MTHSRWKYAATAVTMWKMRRHRFLEKHTATGRDEVRGGGYIADV
jgi:hypothetical protein